MKERLLTLALAIGAFAAFYALMAPKVQPPEERPTRPISIEEGPNGYLGLTRLAGGRSGAGAVAPRTLRQAA